MTAQPDMTGFGRQPAAPTGFRKFAPYVATAAGGGAIMLIGLYAAQLFLPQQMKPGYVAGTMAGSETLGHLQTSGDEQISYDTRSQGATGAVQVSAQSMTGASTLANGADVVCGVSRVGAQVAAKQRPAWNASGSTAEWWYELLRDVGDATCGVGGEIRSAMTDELTTTARRSSILSARTPAEVPQPQGTLQAVAHHYDKAAFDRVITYANTLPPNVLMGLSRDLPTSSLQDLEDVYADRIVRYAAAHPGN